MTIYLYRLIATISVLIIFLRFIAKYIYSYPYKKDNDWMAKDTLAKAKGILILYPLCFIGLIIVVLTQAKNFYFGPEFLVSIAVLLFSLAMLICDYLAKKYCTNKYMYWVIHAVYLIIPIGYILYAMTTDVLAH